LNWLAHLLLSKRDIEYQLGNFLADPLKGKVWEGASPSIKQGMEMHKSIDAFTDTHKIVSQSKARLGAKGYLKGVIIDLLYDHYLASEWDEYANVTQLGFLQSFYTNAIEISQAYPDEPKENVVRLVESNRLAEYASFTGFVKTIQHINKRLSPQIRKKDSTLNYIKPVEQNYDILKSDFKEFFPELMAFFRSHKLGSKRDNYLI
jgi:acyl carrier protein phosphodiesterase